MGRAKLRMELITSEKTRRTAFEKRRKGLEKKAHELSTLCGVKVAMIMCGPSTKNDENVPAVWPNNHDEVTFLIDSYKSKPRKDCRYKPYNVPSFFKDETEKLKQEIEKVNKKMKAVKYPKWDESLNKLSHEQLKEFDNALSKKIEAAKEKINLIKTNNTSQRSNVTESESCLSMKSSVQENKSFMPTISSESNMDQIIDMIQWQQPSAYYYNAQTVLQNQRDPVLMPMDLENSQIYEIPSSSHQNLWSDIGTMEDVGIHDNLSFGRIMNNIGMHENLNFGTMEDVGIHENFCTNFGTGTGEETSSIYEDSCKIFGTMEDVGIANNEPLVGGFVGNSQQIHHQSDPICFQEKYSTSYVNFGTMDEVGVDNNELLLSDEDYALLKDLIGSAPNDEPPVYDYTTNLMPSSDNRHGDLWDIVNFGSMRNMV